MKKLIAYLIILFTTVSIYAQDFQGEVVFEYNYQKLNDAIPLTIEEIEDDLGKGSTYLTRDGFFKQVSDGNFMGYQLYVPEEKRLYYKKSINSDSLYYKDLTKYDNTPFDYQLIKNADTIQGYVCHKIIYKSNDTEEHIYFAPELKQNPEHFKDFAIGNKNKLSEIMKSVYLRYDVISEFIGIRINAIAVDVREFIVSEEEFLISNRENATEQ